MNILILNWRDVRHPKSGGAELVTHEHAKIWVNAGNTVTWLTANYGGASQEKIDGIRMLRRAGSLSIYLYVPFFLIAHGKQFDVVVDEVHGFPFFSPLFTRKPVIVFIHEVAGDIWDYMFSFPVNMLGKALEAIYFKLYKRCLFWTDAPSTIQELSKRGIPKEQCVAIPCPISIDRSLASHLDRKKEKNPTYIFVSRVVRMKGIEEVIKAFSFIVKEQPDARLWIVGGGEENYITQLKAMMREYGAINNAYFWGKVTEEKKLSLMARAHILLHASVKEGWGLVVLEAAYMGTPSVVYNVAGLRDVVKNGKTGIVLEDNSPHQLASESIKLYLDKNKYKQFEHNGKAWVASLTWRDAAAQSLGLLEKVVNS